MWKSDSDYGWWLMEAGFWSVVGLQAWTSLHMDESLVKYTELKELYCYFPPLFPNLLFPVLSGWAGAMNFDEGKLEILSFISLPVSIHCHKPVRFSDNGALDDSWSLGVCSVFQDTHD